MRRTALRRGKPMKRCRLRADGKARERFEGLRDDDLREYVRGLPCIVASDRCVYLNHRSEACHVRSKATGNGDRGQLVAMCSRHHREQHDYGVRSFERVYRVKLAALAAETWLAYEKARGLTV